MASRKRVSTIVEERVLSQSARRCCLCFRLDNDLTEKHGQIAHLDHDPKNGSEDNLAFLCLKHHTLYDSQASQHKNYTTREVKVSRNRLCDAIRAGNHQKLGPTFLKVFVASPKGTERERSIANEVILDLNKLHGQQEAFQLEAVFWEEDSYPSIGSDAQDVINRQLKEYAIFVGIMSTNFGSPTVRAGSGTEEEFDRALERQYSGLGMPKILFYFRNATVKLLDLDIYQALRIHQFKERISKQGVLYSVYEGDDEFRRNIAKHLLKTVREILWTEDRSSSRLGPSKSETTTESLGNWEATTKKLYPQWANYRELLLAQYSPARISLTGVFSSPSPYFRFGFKLLTLRGRPFGEGSIQSHDNNIVVHIGKNTSSPTLFVTSYFNGVRQATNTTISDFGVSRELPIELSIDSDNVVRLKVESVNVYEAHANPEIRSRLLILAWGDEHEYVIAFRNLLLRIG